jgi:hypothetical protein
LVEFAARKLEREGLIRRGVKLDGAAGTFAVLAEYASVLTTAA